MRKRSEVLRFVVILAGAVAAAFADRVSPDNPPIEDLTLAQAWEMAERLQPQLAEAQATLDAAAGRAQQAGTFPHPEAITAAQQIPFGGDARNEREYVAGVGQSLPLGRRLSKSREAEELDREVRVRALEVKRRDIRRRVHSAFAAALYQERAHHTLRETVHHSQQAVAVAQARFEAGDALREDVARAAMESARARLELQRAASLHQQSLAALASAIGDATLPVKSLAGSLETAFEIPTLEALATDLAAQPEMALAEAEVRARTARVDVVRAERIPDMKVELLYHRLEASQRNTFDVGLTIPLPLFNRNQGRLREARAEVVAAEARVRLTRNELAARWRESHLQLAAALAHSHLLKTDILTQADTMMKAGEARYAAGDVSLAELLPLRRDWAAVRLSYLESLREVMQAWATLLPYLDPQ
jgi:cobalt-zinc-cadmium efflux system outer membrane protein